MSQTVTEHDEGVVVRTLERLRRAADEVGAGWTPARWHDVAEGHERSVDRLAELDLRSGNQLTAHTILDPPAALHGVGLEGDRLELTVDTVYPIEIAVDGEIVLAETVPPVAAGPALIEVVKSIRPGSRQTLEATISPLEGQRGDWTSWLPWLNLTFTTPGLRAKFDMLDLAWAQLTLAAEFASTSTEQKVVVAAAELVPEELTGAAVDELGPKLATVADALEPLASQMADIEVHVIGHSHIDLAWLWTWDDAKEVIKRDIRSVLAIMDDYPEATFTHSQPAGYEVVRQEEPELFAQIVRHVRAGRWEPGTMQWVEGDTNLASGEAMANQILEGVTFTREHLGVTPHLFMAPDTFGHSANMPQLVTGAGASVYFHTRCNPGLRTGPRWPAYWWEGADGTRVFACSTRNYRAALTAGAIAQSAIEAARAGLPAGLLVVGFGDHGGGPTRQGYDTLRALHKAPAMPEVRCTTLSTFADRITGSGARLPVHRGESPTIFEGCYTTHTDSKQANRDAENRLTTAEALIVLAGLRRDDELTHAWRDTCFHQFHDILDGSAIPEAYEKTRRDHRNVVAVTEERVDRALAVLTADLAKGTIAVVNPHGHAGTDIVTVPGVPSLATPVLIDADGARTPGQYTDDGLVFVAQVPAFGVATYRLDDGVPGEFGDAPRARARSGTLGHPAYIDVETPHFSAALCRDNGIITSFIDRRAGRELGPHGFQRLHEGGETARPDLGMNVFQIVEESPHDMSAWQYQDVHAEHTVLHGARTEIVEEGPVRVVIRVSHRIRASRIVEDVVFYRDLPRIDFRARVDWQEPGGPEHGVPNLKVAFAPDLDQCEAWFEVPYAAVRRRTNGRQVPALRWADLGESEYGVAILNDSTYAHDVLGNRARLTLIRTGYSPDPVSDRGAYEFRFALVPHAGDWRQARVPHLAAVFNQPLIARVVNATPAGASVSAPWRPIIETAGGLVTTALRAARDGSGIVLRLAEPSGQRVGVVVRGIPDKATVWESDLTERRRRHIGSENRSSLSLTLQPWEVTTFIITQT